jgi:hypothetical protein
MIKTPCPPPEDATASDSVQKIIHAMEKQKVQVSFDTLSLETVSKPLIG